MYVIRAGFGSITGVGAGLDAGIVQLVDHPHQRAVVGRGLAYHLSGIVLQQVCVQGIRRLRNTRRRDDFPGATEKCQKTAKGKDADNCMDLTG